MRKLNNTTRILAIGILAALASGTALAHESPSMVHQVGHSLEKAGTATGHFLKRGVEATAHGVEVGVNAISHGLKRAGDAVDHGTHEAAAKLHAVLSS